MGSVDLTNAARLLLNPARMRLQAAMSAPTVASRYGTAYVAARSAAAVLLAIRDGDESWEIRSDLWTAFARTGVEGAERWAERFAVVRAVTAELTLSLVHVDGRQAQDLLREAEVFYHLIEEHLGLPFREVLPGELPEVTS